MTQSAETFDEHAAIYDLLVDWDRRLANETPFFRQLFEQIGARRVLDAACGTGRHAALFHSWGLQVEGADVSPGMIAHCRARYGEPAGLRWVVRPFEEPIEPAMLHQRHAGESTGETPVSQVIFDAVVCVGNSLSLAGDMAAIDRSVSSMMGGVRPGGMLVIQVLNLWSVQEGKTIWQKCRRVGHEGSDHVLLKSLRRIGDHGYIDFVDLHLSGATVIPRYDAATFLGLDADHLDDVARRAGAAKVETFGSLKREPYERETSTDLILIAGK
jgi:SAM-dependent methyltransferase